MRPDIHPAYREVLFHDTNANTYFVIGSNEGRVASFNKRFGRFKRG